MIIFEKFITGFWRFGKPFFLKYTFVYNGDAKTIGFYLKKNNKNNIDEKNNNNKFSEKKWKLEINFWKIIFIGIFFFIFILLIIAISFYLGKKCNIIRKKHANELNDNYDYISSSFLNNYKKDKKNINKKNYNDNNKQNLELRDESIFNY